MSSYIHFTEEQKQRAAAVDLEEFLRYRGEKLLSSGREKRLASDHSVTVRGNEWYDHAEERGGHAVSFVQRFYGLSYPDAVTMLLGGELGTAYPSAGERTEEPVKPFALPPANKDMRRVFAYRGQPVCNHDNCFAPHQFLESLLQLVFIFRICSCRSLIHNDDIRIL